MLDHHGHSDLGRKLNRMTKDGKWSTIASEVSDDVVGLFAAIGRYDELVSAVDRRFGGASDAVFASTSQDIQPAIPSDVLQDIQAISTPFEGYQSEW